MKKKTASKSTIRALIEALYPAAPNSLEAASARVVPNRMRRRLLPKHLFCLNPQCKELLLEQVPLGICRSCRFAGSWGMFLGGLLVGAVTALLELVR